MTTPTLLHVDQRDFVADVMAIAAKLAADTAWRADFIVGIGRGGLVPATFLSHATGVPMLSVDHSSQQGEFAADLLVTLARRTATGTRLLFVDDINDSGGTLRLLKDALRDAGCVDGHVRFATLIDNIVSGERVDYAARQIDRTTQKDWFVFPWEAVAPTGTLLHDAVVVPARLA